MRSEKYILWIHGQPVEVSEAIYKAYIQGERKMRYFESDLKTERAVYYPDGTIKRLVPSREDSFDRLVDENYIQFADDSAAVEDIIIHNEEINKLGCYGLLVQKAKGFALSKVLAEHVTG